MPTSQMNILKLLFLISIIWLLFVYIPIKHLEVVGRSLIQENKIRVIYKASTYCALADKDFENTHETKDYCLYRLGKQASLNLNNLKSLSVR